MECQKRIVTDPEVVVSCLPPEAQSGIPKITKSNKVAFFIASFPQKKNQPTRAPPSIPFFITKRRRLKRNNEGIRSRVTAARTVV